jgi:hypothetical protein
MTIFGKIIRGVGKFIKAGVNTVLGVEKSPVSLQQNTPTQAITLPLIIVGGVVGFIMLVLTIVAVFKRK